MVRHQGTPLYHILETRNVPSYYSLGSVHQRRKNLLSAILKYLPCVCGGLWTMKEHRGNGTHLLLQRSVRWLRQWGYSEIKAYSKRSRTFIHTCLTRWQLMRHHHKGEECTWPSVTSNSASDATPFQCHTYRHWGRKSFLRVTTSRAYVTELPSGTLLVHATAAIIIFRCSPKEDPPGKAAQVCWVPLWRHEKAPMAHQVSEQPRLDQGGFCPWRIRLSWPNRVHHSRLHIPTQGKAHQSELPHGNNIPG